MQKKRRYGWLVTELVLVSVVVWGLLDPVVVLSSIESMPDGFDRRNLYCVTLAEYSADAPRYQSPGQNFMAARENMWRLLEKVRRYVKRLAARLLPRKGGAGSEQIRLLSAVTPQGPVFYSQTIRALADRSIVFRDEYGAASRFLLEQIRAEALARGYEIITCPCALHPEDKIDHILIPSLRLAFVTDNGWHSAPLPGQQAVRCSRFWDKSNLSSFRARLRFNARAAQELVQQAVDLMASAKACHDELESYYRAAVDFEAVEQAARDCARRIGLTT